ncbi:uncharacterized protein N7511_006437 [Penicillium nucicola]|uniref:uncharacterized protein n=1 Tax=Penicillium nucicola TaxID=1850975 RepID=UPI0025453489|nr:uncharacterized protein N7511_006437 [Penicillium nucicola]KAJ5757743.1 hypothetical protein N7511_006437 [Penicillium nucicola]
MQAFSRFPQALMLRMGAKTTEEKDSFSTSHITSLDFKKGDLVCGIYRVNLRKANKVEFDMQMKTVDFANGRLAISFSEEEDMIVFMSETIMWRRADECQIMPLERPAIQWMHETATMWLLDSGVRYLTDLEA